MALTGANESYPQRDRRVCQISLLIKREDGDSQALGSGETSPLRPRADPLISSLPLPSVSLSSPPLLHLLKCFSGGEGGSWK